MFSSYEVDLVENLDITLIQDLGNQMSYGEAAAVDPFDAASSDVFKETHIPQASSHHPFERR